MSKIIKAEVLRTFEVIEPNLIREEEIFSPLLSLEEKDSSFPSQEQGSEEIKEKQDFSLEQQRLLAFEKGFKEGFEKGYQEGFQKGREEGFQRGLQEGEETLKKIIEEEREKLLKERELERQREREKIENFITSLSQTLEEKVLNLDREIYFLAKEMAQKMVLKSLEADKELPLKIIRSALKYLFEGLEISVRIHPKDLEGLKDYLPTLPKNYKFTFIPDETLSLGGVFIETPMGIIDATLEKRWQKILSVFDDEDKEPSENL